MARAQTTVTLLLSIIALKFTTAKHVPRSQHMTWLDQYMVVCFATVMMPGVESLIVYRLHHETGSTVNTAFFFGSIGLAILYHAVVAFKLKWRWQAAHEWRQSRLYTYKARSHPELTKRASFRGSVFLQAGDRDGTDGAGAHSALAAAGAEPSAWTASSGGGDKLVSRRVIMRAKQQLLREQRDATAAAALEQTHDGGHARERLAEELLPGTPRSPVRRDSKQRRNSGDRRRRNSGDRGAQ